MFQVADGRRDGVEGGRGDAVEGTGAPSVPPETSGGDRPQRAELLVRPVRFLVRTLRGEFQGIVIDPVRQLVHRGLRGLFLGVLACVAVTVFHAIHLTRAGAVVVRLTGEVKADLPLWLALLRTPISLFVPALDLPVWAGLTQLFLGFALAELALGRTRTLVIAYVTTLAGTLSARVMIALGPGAWGGLGLPKEIGQVLDTGPSAAVVGLFTYLSVVRRAPVVFALTGGSMLFEAMVKPNLAGREHLIAVGMAIVLGLLHGRVDLGPAALRRRWWRWRNRRAMAAAEATV
ncbi:hypothetical protein GCM10010394_12380 [Streptomyces crystallinus]|uniref:Integral membrane protein n=1 Tax=Streptomyces crystallinus TaxID=68191 RepID=A0ABN1F8E8_9ACTN